jgi:hypothetical protein
LITLKRLKPMCWDDWGLLQKSDYHRCFRQWQERWNKCIQAQGYYFQEDRTN